jgi:hypothetical protein
VSLSVRALASGRTAADARYAASFDALFARGRSAVLAGTHFRDAPPSESVGRWGVTAVLLPDASVTSRWAVLTAEALELAGSWHWPTGAPHTVHLTVRALEKWRERVPPDDPFAARCAAALRRASAGSRSVRLRTTGLTLTPSGVMACVVPDDCAADQLARRLAEELGDDGYLEASFNRNIWYATLVHFTGDVRRPAALVEWVAEHRNSDLGATVADRTHLVRFRHDGRQPVRRALATFQLGAG